MWCHTWRVVRVADCGSLLNFWARKNAPRVRIPYPPLKYSMYLLVDCPSGLWCSLGKGVCCKRHRGFESLIHRHVLLDDISGGLFRIGIELALKASVRKHMRVRVPHPPPSIIIDLVSWQLATQAVSKTVVLFIEYCGFNSRTHRKNSEGVLTENVRTPSLFY